MEKISEETAKRAAKWWADHLRGVAKLDNGDKSPTGGFTFAVASMLQTIERQKQTPEAIDKFENELAAAIVEENPWCIGVDYHPDYILQHAAEKAGLPLGGTTLPWKTNMWVKGDKITVRCGYGAEDEEIPQ